MLIGSALAHGHENGLQILAGLALISYNTDLYKYDHSVLVVIWFAMAGALAGLALLIQVLAFKAGKKEEWRVVFIFLDSSKGAESDVHAWYSMMNIASAACQFCQSKSSKDVDTGYIILL